MVILFHSSEVSDHHWFMQYMQGCFISGLLTNQFKKSVLDTKNVKTLKLRVCSSFICCWCIASLKELVEEVILNVGITNSVFESSRSDRGWVISKRCSMKIREGKSCPIFLCDFRSFATILASSREVHATATH